MLNKLNQLKINRLSLFICLFFYKVILEVVYIFSISPMYGYIGMNLDIVIYKYCVSSLYLLLILILFPRDKSRPSTYLYLIFTVFIILPMISYYWLSNQSSLYTFFIFLSCLIISIFLKIKPVKIFERINSAKTILNFIFILYVIVAIILIIKKGGIDLRALNFKSIYDLRSEGGLTGILGYLLNWCAKVFCPFFFAYFLYEKNWKKSLVVIIIQALLYMSFGFKAYLFSIGMLVMVIILMKRNKFEKDFTIGFSGVMLISYLLSAFNISIILLNTISFRMLYIPAQIQYQYYDFFVNRDKMLFADGLIGKIFSVESPFDQLVPFVIARYYHDANSSSNTGIFADAYSNGGFLFMILIAVMFAIILYIIDSITGRIPKHLVVAAFSYMMFVINDNSFLTALLTGGMGLMLILLLLFNSSIQTESSKDK